MKCPRMGQTIKDLVAKLEKADAEAQRGKQNIPAMQRIVTELGRRHDLQISAMQAQIQGAEDKDPPNQDQKSQVQTQVPLCAGGAEEQIRALQKQMEEMQARLKAEQQENPFKTMADEMNDHNNREQCSFWASDRCTRGNSCKFAHTGDKAKPREGKKKPYVPPHKRKREKMPE